MPVLSSAWRAIRTLSFLASLYQQWLDYKARKASKLKKEKINESPYDTFSDDFGASAGRVQLSDTELSKLPSNEDKP
ncbi:hypothetical protein [Vibrio campbellii]|uniref:hypothetical protein n=1 Tax=Vibrio campbellii TaxID=680 RepID=UPI00210C5EDD|nr:hypothetical protein [Vibrio campbellii]UTZ44598.1 hypothetical protein HB764_25400 [Vibrio campbellii]